MTQASTSGAMRSQAALAASLASLPAGPALGEHDQGVEECQAALGGVVTAWGEGPAATPRP